MNIKFTITLIVGIVLVILVLFNRGPVDIRIVAFKVKTSIGSIMFWSFFIGIIYTSFIAFLNGIKLRDIIRRQKKEIDALKHNAPALLKREKAAK